MWKKNLLIRRVVEHMAGDKKLSVLWGFSLSRITPWSWQVHTFTENTLLQRALWPSTGRQNRVLWLEGVDRKCPRGRKAHGYNHEDK